MNKYLLVLTMCFFSVSYAALQEIKWLRFLHNVDGVVKLIEAFVHEDKPVLVFNYAECDLTGIIVRAPKLELSSIKCIMKQILQGLHNIHSHFLMHRDIKGNLLPLIELLFEI